MTVTSSSRKSLVFDLDGTIVDCKRRDHQLYVDILMELGRVRLSRDNYWPLRQDSTPIIDILNETGAGDVINEFLSERQRRVGLPHYLALDALLPGAKEILRAAGGRYDLHLVTAREQVDATKQQLVNLRIFDLFKTMTVTFGKDKEEAFKFIGSIEYVIGDTEKDIEPAKRLGIKTIAVTSGIRSRKFLESLAPSVILNNISELAGVLSLDEGPTGS